MHYSIYDAHIDWDGLGVAVATITPSTAAVQEGGGEDVYKLARINRHSSFHTSRHSQLVVFSDSRAPSLFTVPCSCCREVDEDHFQI